MSEAGVGQELVNGTPNNTGLISQNPKDRVVARIAERREEHKAQHKTKREAEREKKYGEVKSRFAQLFHVIAANRHFGLGVLDIKEFGDEELLELERLVAREALSGSIVPRLICFSPGVGQVVVGSIALFNLMKRIDNDGKRDYNPRPGKSWSYRTLRGRLQRVYGKDWFPFDVVRRGYY